MTFKLGRLSHAVACILFLMLFNTNKCVLLFIFLYFKLNTQSYGGKHPIVKKYAAVISTQTQEKIIMEREVNKNGKQYVEKQRTARMSLRAIKWKNEKKIREIF